MTRWSDEMLERLRPAFREAADPERAVPMAKYMRDQFPFLGIPAPEHKRLLSAVTRSVGVRPDEADLDAFARGCYREAEREFHYAAVATLRSRSTTLTADSIPLVHHLVVTHSWWDTVDAIASHLAGGIVARHPRTVEVMDCWATSENMWLARTAILHQLRFGAETDAERLFRYCLARADEADFFYRKAIGWALREYARTDPEAVRRFCDRHQAELSALSLREARKKLDR